MVLTALPPTLLKHYSSIVIPILLAVPATILIAASIEPAFKSFIFNSAISLSCSFFTFATFSLLGTPEPLSIPTAFFNKTEAGGVLVINVNDLSAYTAVSYTHLDVYKRQEIYKSSKSSFTLSDD